MDEKDKKRLKSIYVGQIIDRIILILVFFFLMLNLGASIFMGLQIRKFTKTIEPAVEALSEIDVEQLNNALTTINTAVDVLKVDEALETLSKVDFDGLSNVISGIDVDKLNSTLTKIDEATTFMKKIGDGMNKFLNQFGINLPTTDTPHEP